MKGAEQQELVEFARKVLEQAEKNGDIFKPGGEGSRSSQENTDDSPPENENAPQALASKWIPSSFFLSCEQPYICIMREPNDALPTAGSDLQLELVEPEEN